MVILKDYATKTEITERVNKSVDGFWPVGIDYGFSGVKGFAPNKVFCYPNCAVKVDDFSSLIESSPNDILLKDNEGCWIIGEKAHETITPASAMNYETEMYERNRYFLPAFSALMKAGLGIAIMSNYAQAYNGEPIFVQTGLPPEYKDMDSADLKSAIAGDYEFELKIGKNPFRHYKFTINENYVFIMDQPMGSLYSAITDNEGAQGQFGLQVLKSKTLVFDPGFKTLDIYNISAGRVFGKPATFDNLGMHEIFQRTVDGLKGANITVLGMQSALRKGYVTILNKRTMVNKKEHFEDLLEKNTKEVCMEAVQKLVSLYNYMQDHDFLIVTGGTGNAWYPMIKDYFRNMENLTILSANRNDKLLSNTYSNVRGYYFSLVSMLRHRFKK